MISYRREGRDVTPRLGRGSQFRGEVRSSRAASTDGSIIFEREWRWPRRADRLGLGGRIARDTQNMRRTDRSRITKGSPFSADLRAKHPSASMIDSRPSGRQTALVHLTRGRPCHPRRPLVENAALLHRCAAAGCHTRADPALARSSAAISASHLAPFGSTQSSEALEADPARLLKRNRLAPVVSRSPAARRRAPRIGSKGARLRAREMRRRPPHPPRTPDTSRHGSRHPTIDIVRDTAGLGARAATMFPGVPPPRPIIIGRGVALGMEASGDDDHGVPPLLDEVPRNRSDAPDTARGLVESAPRRRRANLCLGRPAREFDSSVETCTALPVSTQSARSRPRRADIANKVYHHADNAQTIDLDMLGRRWNDGPIAVAILDPAHPTHCFDMAQNSTSVVVGCGNRPAKSMNPAPSVRVARCQRRNEA